MAEFEGKVALVAGGASGIGLACARLLASRGASVAICDRDAVALEAARVAVSRVGAPVFAHLIDVTDDAAVAEWVASVGSAFGRIDIVVAAAGIQRYGVVDQTPVPVWDEVFAVNVKSCFLLARHAMAHLRAVRGSIVLVSSVQAFIAQNNAVAYVASKGAINSFARSLAVDEAAHGVRANVVCPGSVDTPMLRASARQFSDGSDEGEQLLVEQWGRLHPMGRVARAEEVAEVVAFLAGDRASFVTGASIPVDGGLLASVAVSVADS